MTQEIDADLGLQERKKSSQSLPIRVRTVSVGRQAQNRAEKSHPTKNQCLRWNQVPLWDRNLSQSFLRYDAASGNWQPTIARRVMRAPNASESGKESVASSHTSPFYESSDSIIGYLKARVQKNDRQQKQRHPPIQPKEI
jgi:hypothetical protein